ncbi:MAG: hypothetical protein IJZ53_09205 [Tyzzerella sp.]|nr:hypothetical protein [Tyzzerella sp.]
MISFQAHRGVQCEKPENTMEAVIAAIEQGYDVIEVDVDVTKDMQFVLLHDHFINRTGRHQDGSEIEEQIAISDITYEEALQYDYGMFFSEEFKGTKIPLLEDVLKVVKAHGLELKIDNKYQRYNKEQRLTFYQLLKPYEDMACLTCFDVAGIEEALEYLPNMSFHYDGLVTEEILEELSKKISKDRLTIWFPYQNASTTWVQVPFVDKASAQLTKQYGKLGVWILSEEAELKDAEELGADIIETVGTLKPKRK